MNSIYLLQIMYAEFRIQLVMIKPNESDTLKLYNNSIVNSCYTPSYRFWNMVG